MSRYYYLASTLPLLSLDSERFPAGDDFLELCARELTPADYALLLQARLEPVAEEPEAGAQEAADVASGLDTDPHLGDGSPEPSGRLVLRRWINWERCLRNELVRLRSQALGVDAVRYLRPASFVAGVTETAKAAVSAESPLEGELILDRARWALLDELEVGQQFGIAQLITYVLRLKILERRSRMTSERGTERFQTWYEGVVAPARTAGA